MENNSKEITIDRDSLVINIQKEFTLFYPFLKIEFSSNTKRFHSSSFETENATNVKLNVNEDRTIAEIEKDCVELLGLFIQVFRKSGNVWNVISLTKSWTLQSQNLAGEFISTEMQKAS